MNVYWLFWQQYVNNDLKFFLFLSTAQSLSQGSFSLCCSCPCSCRGYWECPCSCQGGEEGGIWRREWWRHGFWSLWLNESTINILKHSELLCICVVLCLREGRVDVGNFLLKGWLLKFCFLESHGSFVELWKVMESLVTIKTKIWVVICES